MFRRFLIAHMLAYVPAFVWTAAWVPNIVRANVDRLSTGPELPEAELKSFLLNKMILPALVAFTLPHLVGLWWIFAKDKSGRALFFGSLAAFTLAGMVYGGVAWLRLLRG